MAPICHPLARMDPWPASIVLAQFSIRIRVIWSFQLCWFIMISQQISNEILCVKKRPKSVRLMYQWQGTDYPGANGASHMIVHCPLFDFHLAQWLIHWNLHVGDDSRCIKAARIPCNVFLSGLLPNHRWYAWSLSPAICVAHSHMWMTNKMRIHSKSEKMEESTYQPPKNWRKSV